MELAGTEIPILWRGRRARAFVPQPLAERDLTLDATTAVACGAAAATVGHGAEAMPDDYAPLARLLLRSEGIASSFIEGVTAPVVDIVLAEHRNQHQQHERQDQQKRPNDDDGHRPAAWVAANLAATDRALDHAAGTKRVTVHELCAWHTSLMAGSPTPAVQVGRLRDEQGWIGGSSPLDAHLVTPPPDRVPELLRDLLAYANRTDVDPVAQAAVVHAQFELVHPFADGNGRLGRTLVAWSLTRRLSLVTPPAVSTRIAADVGGYTAGLTQFRFGRTDAWVRWFAGTVSGAGDRQRQLVAEVAALQARWSRALTARKDSSAWQVLDLLPRHLVLTARLVADELALTPKAAHAALHALVAAGVLTAHGPQPETRRGRPPELYVSEELLGLAGTSVRAH